jgi:hypothetical protein
MEEHVGHEVAAAVGPDNILLAAEHLGFVIELNPDFIAENGSVRERESLFRSLSGGGPGQEEPGGGQ